MRAWTRAASRDFFARGTCSAWIAYDPYFTKFCRYKWDYYELLRSSRRIIIIVYFVRRAHTKTRWREISDTNRNIQKKKKTVGSGLRVHVRVCRSRVHYYILSYCILRAPTHSAYCSCTHTRARRDVGKSYGCVCVYIIYLSRLCVCVCHGEKKIHANKTRVMCVCVQK